MLIKPFVCDHKNSSKRFTTKSNLKTHENSFEIISNYLKYSNVWLIIVFNGKELKKSLD